MKTGGFASELIALINDHALLDLQAPVKRVSGFDTIMPYFKMENDYIPSVERIVDGIEETAGF